MTNPIIKSINNSIIKVVGEFNYKQNSFFKLKNGLKAFLLSATTTEAFLLVEKTNKDILVGEEIFEIKNDKIDTYEEFFGHIIDIQGNILSSSKNIELNNFVAQGDIFAAAKKIYKRKKLNTQLPSGILGIDLFTPLGKGQRKLILGDRQTGKTSIALSFAINNKDDQNLRIIYASVGQKKNSLSEIYSIIQDKKIAHKTMIITSDSDNSFERFLSPYVAMAHAENLSSKGYDVLLIIDDLTKHADIYREISLLIYRPVGREAYPGDIFFMHSQLLERGGNFVDGGSITVLPIVETINEDITAFIPSNIISITDGQLLTSKSLFNGGNIPAINYSLSVSRTGSSVQLFEISQVSKKLYKIYNNYQKNIKLKDVKLNLSKTLSTLFLQGELLEKFLIQSKFSFYNLVDIYLISKIIEWNTIYKISELNIKEISVFLKNIFAYNTTAKQLIKNFHKGLTINQNLLQDFISSVLNDFLEYKQINTKLELKNKFIKLSKKEIESYKKEEE